MSELKEMFKELREAKKARNAKRKLADTNLLDLNNIQYTSTNEGQHLIVKHNGKVVDFWPSTGLWTDRGTKRKSKSGAMGLLAHLGIE